MEAPRTLAVAAIAVVAIHAGVAFLLGFGGKFSSPRSGSKVVWMSGTLIPDAAPDRSALSDTSEPMPAVLQAAPIPLAGYATLPADAGIPHEDAGKAPITRLTIIPPPDKPLVAFAPANVPPCDESDVEQHPRPREDCTRR